MVLINFTGSWLLLML